MQAVSNEQTIHNTVKRHANKCNANIETNAINFKEEASAAVLKKRVRLIELVDSEHRAANKSCLRLWYCLLMAVSIH